MDGHDGRCTGATNQGTHLLHAPRATKKAFNLYTYMSAVTFFLARVCRSLLGPIEVAATTTARTSSNRRPTPTSPTAPSQPPPLLSRMVDHSQPIDVRIFHSQFPELIQFVVNGVVWRPTPIHGALICSIASCCCCCCCLVYSPPPPYIPRCCVSFSALDHPAAAS